MQYNEIRYHDPMTPAESLCELHQWATAGLDVAYAVDGVYARLAAEHGSNVVRLVKYRHGHLYADADSCSIAILTCYEARLAVRAALRAVGINGAL